MDRFLKSVGQQNKERTKNKSWLIEKTKLMIRETEKQIVATEMKRQKDEKTAKKRSKSALASTVSLSYRVADLDISVLDYESNQTAKQVKNESGAVK